MYLFLLKKNKGESQPFPTSSIVELYLKKYGTDDIIIANPGYLSTAANTIGDFCNKFYVGNNVVMLTSGMNGIRKVGNSTVLQEHIANFDLLKSKKQHSVAIHNKSINWSIDHSKCAFFLDHADTDEDNLKLEIDDNYLFNAKVKAILVGSSNMSFTTYYGATADKGECDIFIMDDTIFSEEDVRSIFEVLEQQYNSDVFHQIALFKELTSNMDLNTLYKSFLNENN